MNILMLSWKDIKNPDAGGAESVTFELAKRLVQEGNRVTIFCRGFSKAPSTEDINGIKIYRKGNIFTTYFHAWIYYKKLDPKPDLVIDMLNTVFWQTPLYVPKYKRVAYVNQLAREVLFYELPFLVSRVAYFLERLQFMSYKTTPMLCFSESAKKDLIEIGIKESNIHMFPLGIDLTKYRHGQKAKSPFFVCVNRLVRMKRTDLAIKAIGKLKSRYPEVRLHIIGKGYQREKLESLVRDLKLSDNVSFDFDCNDEQKMKFMGQAWALIFPSVKEGWGITVMEAAACGTPTIATKVSGLVDSVQEFKNGIFISKNPSADELAKAMESIINDEDLRRRLNENSLKLSKNYSWENTFNIFYRSIQKLNSGHKRNILVLSWRGPKHYNAGGAEISVHEHAKAWVKAGFNVTLFTSKVLGLKPEEIIDGIKIIRQGRQIFGVQIHAFFYYLRNRKYFNLLVDNFHGISFFTPLYSAKPKIAFIHEVAKEVWFLNYLYFPLNYIFGFIGYLLEPLIFRFIYHKVPFITVSDSTKKDLMEWGIPDKNIHVIHNGINIIHPEKTIKKEEVKTLIFLGEISKDKGIEDAVNAFYKLSLKDEQWQFWIVGKGEMLFGGGLRELINKLGLTKKIKFWGFVSERKKFELLKRAHILIHPSRREGWGQVVIEAAAMGTPTVGYRVAGLKDSIIEGKTGFLAEVTTQDLADKIENLMNDNELYKKFQHNCIRWSKNFIWQEATEQSIKLLKDYI